MKLQARKEEGKMVWKETVGRESDVEGKRLQRTGEKQVGNSVVC